MPYRRNVTQHKTVAAKHLCDNAVCNWVKLQADIAEEYRAKPKQ